MNFNDLLIAGVLSVVIMFLGGAYYMNYITSMGIDTSSSNFAYMNQSTGLLSAINGTTSDVINVLNSTKPEPSNIVSFVGDPLRWWSIIKGLIDLSFTILIYPLYLLKSITIGLWYGLHLQIPDIIPMVVELIFVIGIITYILYILFGKWGTGDRI